MKAMQVDPHAERLCSLGSLTRLRNLLMSSAFTPEERDLVWRNTPTMSEDRIHDAICWALDRVRDHDREQAPLNNRMASLAEKVAYRLELLEAGKPIPPILPKRKEVRRQAS